MSDQHFGRLVMAGVNGALEGEATAPVNLATRFRLAWAVINLYSVNPSTRTQALDTLKTIGQKLALPVQKRLAVCVRDSQRNDVIRTRLGHAGYPEGFLTESVYTEFQRTFKHHKGIHDANARIYQPCNDWHSQSLSMAEVTNLSRLILFHCLGEFEAKDVQQLNTLMSQVTGREKVEWLSGLLSDRPANFDFEVSESGVIQFDNEMYPAKTHYG